MKGFVGWLPAVTVSDLDDDIGSPMRPRPSGYFPTGSTITLTSASR